MYSYRRQYKVGMISKVQSEHVTIAYNDLYLNGNGRGNPIMV